MNVEQLSTVSVGGKPLSGLGSEPMKEEQIQHGETARRSASGNVPADKKLQAETVVKNIKELAQEGIFKIRFELNEANNEIVINLVDQKTGEITRRIPSEEILGVRAALADLRGNFIETRS